MTLPAGIPPEAFDQHSAIVGRTGSGKTYRAKTVVERLIEERRRVCIVDPTGAWWGLRSSADGKRAGYPVIVLGGEHGDIPITEHAAQPLAELIAAGNVPCVVDLSEFMVGQRHRFMEVFADNLYRRNRLPLHLVIDEADDFAPQNPLPESRRMLERVDRIVRRGRIRGFRVMMITQRPAALHKNILTQASTLVAMRLMGPQDRKAIEAWIKDQADPDAGRAVIASLPTLRLGEGWTWAPELGVLEKSVSPKLRTYDSSASPEDGGDTVAPVALAEVDLSAIHARFAAFEAEAKANDPAALKARIKALEKEVALAKRQPAASAPDPVAIDRARQDGMRAMRSTLKVAIGDALKSARQDIIDAASNAIAAVSRRIADADLGEILLPGVTPHHVVYEMGRQAFAAEYDRRSAAATASGDGTAGAPAVDGGVPPRHQRVLDAIAWYGALGILKPTRGQVAFMAGKSPKGGSFNNDLGRLRAQRLIDYPDFGTVSLTAEGSALANHPGEAGSDADLHRRVYEALPPRLVAILQELVDAWPGNRSRNEVAAAIGKAASGGSFNNDMGRLHSLGLIRYPTQGYAAADDSLFPNQERT